MIQHTPPIGSIAIYDKGVGKIPHFTPTQKGTMAGGFHDQEFETPYRNSCDKWFTGN